MLTASLKPAKLAIIEHAVEPASLMLGASDGRGQFIVRNREVPARAGFPETPESIYVLVDLRTSWKVHLLEGRPRGITK